MAQTIHVVRRKQGKKADHVRRSLECCPEICCTRQTGSISSNIAGLKASRPISAPFELYRER